MEQDVSHLIVSIWTNWTRTFCIRTIQPYFSRLLSLNGYHAYKFFINNPYLSIRSWCRFFFFFFFLLFTSQRLTHLYREYIFFLKIDYVVLFRKPQKTYRQNFVDVGWKVSKVPAHRITHVCKKVFVSSYNCLIHLLFILDNVAMSAWRASGKLLLIKWKQYLGIQTQAKHEGIAFFFFFFFFLALTLSPF